MDLCGKLCIDETSNNYLSKTPNYMFVSSVTTMLFERKLYITDKDRSQSIYNKILSVGIVL